MTFDVPSITSVNRDEFTPNQNVIAFAPELIDFILEDKKLTTYRFGTKYDYLKIGDEVDIQNSQTKENVCRVTIIGKSSMTFTELPIKNGFHESYKDKEHQREVLSPATMHT